MGPGSASTGASTLASFATTASGPSAGVPSCTPPESTVAGVGFALGASAFLVHPSVDARRHPRTGDARRRYESLRILVRELIEPLIRWPSITAWGHGRSSSLLGGHEGRRGEGDRRRPGFTRMGRSEGR